MRHFKIIILLLLIPYHVFSDDTLKTKEFIKTNFENTPDVIDAYACGKGKFTTVFVCSDSTLWPYLVKNLSQYKPDTELVSSCFFLIDPTINNIQPINDDKIEIQGPLSSYLEDQKIQALFFLEQGQSAKLCIKTASRGFRTPLSVLNITRSALQNSSIEYFENPIDDFYAFAGLADGEPNLTPWLKSKLPAIGLQLGTQTELDILLKTLVSAKNDDAVYDINYISYPILNKIVSISDAQIIIFIITMFFLLALMNAFGILRGKRRIASLSTIVSEALYALFLALIALTGSRLLHGLMLFFIKMFLGFESSFNIYTRPIIFLLKILSTLAVYYTASGLIAKLGLHTKHSRIDAARAALLILCINAIVLFAVFPPASLPVLVVALLSLFTSMGLVAATSSLILTVILILPFIDPRIIMNLSLANLGLNNTSAMMSALLMSVLYSFALAPLGLWLSAALSPQNRLLRAKRTFVLWLIASVVLSLIEALLSFKLK